MGMAIMHASWADGQLGMAGPPARSFKAAAAIIVLSCTCPAMRKSYGIERLTPEEVRFFKTQGYLIKRGALDPALVAVGETVILMTAPFYPY